MHALESLCIHLRVNRRTHGFEVSREARTDKASYYYDPNLHTAILSFDRHPHTLAAGLCHGNKHVVIVQHILFSRLVQLHLRKHSQRQGRKDKMQFA